MTLEIHDCQNPNAIHAQLVEKRKWESAQESTSNSALESRAGFRMFLDQP
jgi:hypothetical protein